MEIDYQITAESQLSLRTNGNKSTLKQVDITFSHSKDIPSKNFFEANGVPNAEGFKAITQAFIQGLGSNIHACHQKGIWDSAEHLRYIIEHLEDNFIQTPDTVYMDKGTDKKLK